MSEGYVIEIADEIVGIVVRQAGERSYLFHASAREFNALDGRRFASPWQAERATKRHADRVGERRRRS